MLHSALRWLIPLLALLVLGPIAGYLTASLHAPDGGPDATLLVSAAPMRGLLAGLGVLALAGVAGAIGARMIGNRSGLFHAGLVLVGAAWGTGRIDVILGRTLTGATMYTIALEGLIVGALGVLLAWVIMEIPTIPHPVHLHLPPEPTTLKDKAAPMAILAAMAAAGITVFLLAQESLKGQTFAAAAVGAIFAGAAGRVASQTVSCVVFFAGIAILGAASPAVATLVHHGDPGVVKAAMANELFRLARPMPLDWLAGAFIGLPIGLSWAGSMVEKQQQ